MEYFVPKILPEAFVLIQKLKVKTNHKTDALVGISHFKSLSSIKDEFQQEFLSRIKGVRNSTKGVEW
jgi:hypothetical protein